MAAERSALPTTASRPGGLLWPLIIGVLASDQAAKALMETWLPRLEDPRGFEVIEGLLYFHHKRNTGMAFSMLAEHPGLLTVMTSLAIALIAWWAWNVPRNERLTRLAFALVLGGALGNLADRLLRGYVVDYIDFIIPGFVGDWYEAIFGSRHYATFNLADAAICVGMGLLILTLLLPRHGQPAAGVSETPGADPAP